MSFQNAPGPGLNAPGPWLPRSTRSALKEGIQRSRVQAGSAGPSGNATEEPTFAADDNLGLWLDRFTPFDGSGKCEKHVRENWLSSFCVNWVSEAGKDGVANLDKRLPGYHGPDKLLRLELTLEGRLVVDYGRASALESSLSFHPLWSVPRIPASALKGVAHHALTELEGGAELEAVLFGKTELEATNTDLCHNRQCPRAAEKNRLAGLTPPERMSLSMAGALVFYDAFPKEGRFTLEQDILTPHYGNYYQGDKPPSDYQSPVPFTYLTVAKTTFITWLGVDPNAQLERMGECLACLRGIPFQPEDFSSATLLKLGQALLTHALAQGGVGARTGSGFGRLGVKAV